MGKISKDVADKLDYVLYVLNKTLNDILIDLGISQLDYFTTPINISEDILDSKGIRHYIDWLNTKGITYYKQLENFKTDLENDNVEISLEFLEQLNYQIYVNSLDNVPHNYSISEYILAVSEISNLISTIK